MQLPFLKSARLPRVAPEPREEKSYGLNSDDKLEEHCTQELMESAMEKNAPKFRAALEALVHGLFEKEGPKDG